MAGRNFQIVLLVLFATVGPVFPLSVFSFRWNGNPPTHHSTHCLSRTQPRPWGLTLVDFADLNACPFPFLHASRESATYRWNSHVGGNRPLWNCNMMNQTFYMKRYIAKRGVDAMRNTGLPPLSMAWIQRYELVCSYKALRFSRWPSCVYYRSVLYEKYLLYIKGSCHSQVTC